MDNQVKMGCNQRPWLRQKRTSPTARQWLFLTVICLLTSIVLYLVSEWDEVLRIVVLLICSVLLLRRYFRANATQGDFP